MDETLLLIGDGDDTEANTKCQYYYSDCQSANSGESIERGICEVDFDRKADTFAIGQIEAGNLILLWQKNVFGSDCAYRKTDVKISFVCIFMAFYVSNS